MIVADNSLSALANRALHGWAAHELHKVMTICEPGAKDISRIYEEAANFHGYTCFHTAIARRDTIIDNALDSGPGNLFPVNPYNIGDPEKTMMVMRAIRERILLRDVAAAYALIRKDMVVAAFHAPASSRADGLPEFTPATLACDAGMKQVMRDTGDYQHWQSHAIVRGPIAMPQTHKAPIRVC